MKKQFVINNVIISINIFIHNLNDIFNIEYILINLLKKCELIKKMKNRVN